jgi:hypothetical protein
MLETLKILDISLKSKPGTWGEVGEERTHPKRLWKEL